MDDDSDYKARQAVEGAKGGKRTLEKYGKNFFSRIATQRWIKERKTEDGK